MDLLSTVDTIERSGAHESGYVCRELRGRGRAERSLNVIFRHVNLAEQSEASPRLDEAVGERDEATSQGR